MLQCPLGNTVYIRDVSFKHFMHMNLLNMRFWNYIGKICYNSIAYKQKPRWFWLEVKKCHLLNVMVMTCTISSIKEISVRAFSESVFFFFFSLLLSAWNISSWIYTLWIWLCPWTTKILMLVHLLTVNFELIFRIQKARSYSFNLAPNPFKGNFPTRFTIPFLHLR